MKNVSIMLNRRVLFDGGMGTQLSARGLAAVCPEMNLVNDFDKVVAIHADYAAAGATVLTTNTFGANAIKLGKHGLAARAAELNALGVKAARQAADAAGGDVLVALDMGPTGELMSPFGELTFDRAYAAFREQADAGRAAGADLAIIETMSSLAEGKIAALAARDAGLPFVLSFTFEASGRTLMGDTPECCAVTAEALGAELLATNCSGGPEQMLPIIQTYAASTSLPLLCQPNAGLPQVINGQTTFPYSPEAMLEPMRALIAAGADAIGGCCGTTPAHISAFSALEFGLKPRPAVGPALCSTREVARISDAQGLAELPLDEAEDFDGDSPALIVNVEGFDAGDALELLESLTSMVHAPLVFKGEDEATLRALINAYAGVPGVIGHAALARECGARTL